MKLGEWSSDFEAPRIGWKNGAAPPVIRSFSMKLIWKINGSVVAVPMIYAPVR